MSSDGEITKNQEPEGETKPNLDTTDSSQDSEALKSETEDEKNKSTEEIKDEKVDEDAKKEEDVENDVENDVEVKENDTDKKEQKEENEAKDTKNIKNNKEENNKEKKDEKSEEDSEEDEKSEEEEEGDDKKDVPLLDQPLEKSGKRERKIVQRFNEDLPTEAKEITKVDIPEGAGTQLGDIPRIDASISRFKTDDLKLLHKVIFKTPGKTAVIKKNIKKFNGFDFKKDSEAYTKKVQTVAKMEIKQLKSICEMLDLEKNGKKEEISERICEFLLEPKDSGKPVGGGRPKRTAAVRANNRGYSSHDDNSDSDSQSRRASRRAKGKRVNLKEESSSESDAEFNPSEEDEDKPPRVTAKRRPSRGAKKPQDSDDEASEIDQTPSESDDSDEPKAKRKRGTPAKVQNNKSKKSPKKKASAKKTPAKKKGGKAANKRSKDESESEEEDDKDNSEHNDESSSGDDEPLVKKSKAPQPPTDDEIKTYVKEILEGANLEEITMKTVCKQVYAHYPDFDLAHKKDFIKSTVKSLIST